MAYWKKGEEPPHMHAAEAYQPPKKTEKERSEAAVKERTKRKVNEAVRLHGMGTKYLMNRQLTGEKRGPSYHRHQREKHLKETIQKNKAKESFPGRKSLKNAIKNFKNKE